MAAVERTGSRGFQGYMSRPSSTGDEDDLDSEVQTSDVFPDSIRAEVCCCCCCLALKIIQKDFNE